MKNDSLQRRAKPELEYFRRMLEAHPEYFIESHDIGTAAALLCLNFKIILVTKECSGRPSFIFEIDDESGYDSKKVSSTKVMVQYNNGQLFVNAKSFFENLKGLEDELRSEYAK